MISFPCSKARDVPVKFHITCIIQLFFKPLSISWSNFYQLHVLMISLRTQDIIMFGEMNSKLASENSSGNESRAEGEFFFFFIRKWLNECSKLSLSWLNHCTWASGWELFRSISSPCNCTRLFPPNLLSL